MVAYSFRPRFCLPIVEGTKGGTIRAVRKNGHAKPGDELQLYTGMRTRSCKLIARKRCIGVSRILLNFERNTVLIGDEIDGAWGIVPKLDVFARFDGFDNWGDLRNFWHAENGTSEYFEGFHVRWQPLPRAIA